MKVTGHVPTGERKQGHMIGVGFRRKKGGSLGVGLKKKIDFFWCKLPKIWVIQNIFVTFVKICLFQLNSSVARAFPGGRLAHPESQSEEEN